MPIKKKTTAAKKPAAKKPAVLGPKAKLMKLLVGTLRNKAKKLGISDVSKRTKENLAQSIMLAEARKKKGTTLGKKATAKKAASTRGADRQTKGTPNESIKADRKRKALASGRRTSKSGNVYSERRRDRSDKPGQLLDRTEYMPGAYGAVYELSVLGFREIGMLAQLLQAWSDQKLSSLAKKYFAELEDWGYNSKSGFVFLVDIYYNVLMYNDSIKKLDLFLSTPYEGQEGFIEDLLIDFKTLDEEDQDFVERYYKDLDAAEKRAYKKPVG
jgi:hypothetical protein